MICRIGEQRYNNQGALMTIIRYRNNKDLDIQFDDGYILNHVKYYTFLHKELKNPMFPQVYGVGCIGVGEFNKTEHEKIYAVWSAMLKRCYTVCDRDKSYIGCSVCDYWLNFQNYARWYVNNKWNEECKCVDKDILIKGNKIYSPDTCIFVDEFINSLFTKRQNHRGLYPIGVVLNQNRYKKFNASCNYYGKNKFIGNYSSPEEAFNAYKKFKESYIKQVADEYKNKYPNFPQKLYDAMYNYEVEITD